MWTFDPWKPGTKTDGCATAPADEVSGDDTSAGSTETVTQLMASMRASHRAAESAAHARRLEALRARIEAGTYVIDPAIIAARLLRDEG
jgi:anti-sigma28 factor (negative regulator of flagellin synthesis)